ncbi:MAG: methyltransferase FkbM family [Chitinophagaceae bacterium]|nr:methyltransferase FkbM family [Chitinophagaceae bacterium]
MNLFKRNRKKFIKYSEGQLEALKKAGDKVTGSIEIFHRHFHFHHAKSFYNTYEEIFINNIYKFNPSSNTPYIVDCGANMGLSVLFFAKNYPGATIIAFEPEPPIFEILTKNIETYKLKNVTAIKKAVWNSETTLEFYTDNGMGGSVENVLTKQTPQLVETIRLKSILKDNIDFLKLDIEGAEYIVLNDCKEELKNVKNIFVEYHSYSKKEQHLEDILGILKAAGFRYHLRQSFSRERPFIDKNNICENMDMAINIFAYREN